MRGIQYLTRVAAATKRVLLVYQESPAPMERFLSPALIDWRLTPDLGLDPERDVVQSGKHYRISASDRNKLREDISSGVFQTLTARVVTVCTNKPSHTDGSGSIPKVSINGTALGVLARALFRLSPEVEEATDDALLKIGIRRGQAYVAAHVRLGGLSGEEKLLGRFSQDPPQILAAAAACAANLTAAYGMQPGAPAAAAAAAAPAAEAEAAAGATADLPYVLVTDNDQLRQQVAAGKLRPWITPELHPAHFTVSRLPGSEEQPQRQQQQQSRGQESELEESHEEVGPGEDGEDSIKAEAEEGTQAQQRRRLAEELRRKRRRRRIPQAKRGGGGGSGRSGSDEGGVAELAASAASGSGGGSRRAVALREQRDTAQQAAVQEELARLQVLNMADLGILMRATCVLISPSGFSIQAHLLSDQPCAMRLQHCPGAT
ncbi:hypothetical protein HYH02_009292 [Chlamydomonas schloesseri]|uniref:Uncharacterized protein n=1 Tax=Chlamydomonas schloesseri TaxID=2026947 RepID=A0A835W9I0_9CHLO|nr:hypothetical protein HYH02_009292 [Chlamydomonas schloesseri]|eukprot:KAG2443218.1 hypothetical protein HYH02_009292 [Chlamydomonas schloesseri]